MKNTNIVGKKLELKTKSSLEITEIAGYNALSEHTENVVNNFSHCQNSFCIGCLNLSNDVWDCHGLASYWYTCILCGLLRY